MKKKQSIIKLSLVIFLLLLLLGVSYYYHTIYSKTRFDKFLDESFRYIASENALLLHMNLENPEDYGIQEDQITLLPDLSEKASEERIKQYDAMLEKLHHFSLKDLTKDQQYLALLLDYNLKEYLEMEKEFPYHETTLGGNGTLVNLSILLSEYSLKSKEDLVLYEKILRNLPSYLDSVVDYEVRRQKYGIDPTTHLIDGTLDYIDDLLDSEDSNIFIVSFENRIRQTSFLSESEKKSYLEKNKKLVKKLILPAFKKTRASIEKQLKPSDRNLSIASYPEGKSYYAHLLTSEVGTSLSPEACYQIFTQDMAVQEKQIQAIYQENNYINLDYLSAILAIDEPDAILKDLENVTKIEFPALSDVDYEVSEVYNNLGSMYASAYYVTPPFGYEGKNHIFLQAYYNKDYHLYTTLAHEGYPGHLYQTNYSYQHMIHPIQIYLKSSGYNEGWGIYAEYYSYDFLKFKDMDETTTEQVRNYIHANSLYNLDLSCVADIMVNYLGYDKERLAEYMKRMHVDSSDSDKIYDYVIEKPCDYLNYGIGYYEFKQLLKEEQKKSGFSMLDFHTQVLSYGSCPFDLLKMTLNQGENDLSFVDNNE